MKNSHPHTPSVLPPAPIRAGHRLISQQPPGANARPIGASDRGRTASERLFGTETWDTRRFSAPPSGSVVNGLHLGRDCKAGRVPARPSPVYRWLLSPSDVDPVTRTKLAARWLEVSNVGGAVGFPFIPVTLDEVAAATERLVGGLDPHTTRLLTALRGDELLGWLTLDLNRNSLTSHWARVGRVQTALAHRGTGVGQALMEEVARSAQGDLGLDQLHLELRSGQGLEGFYQSCGWREVGRWPGALRLGPGDDRDEVLMLLEL